LVTFFGGAKEPGKVLHDELDEVKVTINLKKGIVADSLSKQPGMQVLMKRL